MRNRNDLAQFQLDGKVFMTDRSLLDIYIINLTYLACLTTWNFLKDTKLFSLFFTSKRGPGVFLAWKHLRQEEWRASLFYGFEVSIRNPSSPADLW